jgi:hypothetical protein
MSACSALAALVVLASCDDNPVDDHDHLECDHFEAEGFDLEAGGSTLHSQFQGRIYGTLTVSEGATVTGIEVKWLDVDSMHVAPEPDCDQTLRWQITQPATIGITASGGGNPWAFDLEGKQVGSTTFQVQIFHSDHADFTSLPITVDVTTVAADSIAPPALVIMDGADAIATHNFDETNGPGQVTGPIVLRMGTTRAALEAWFVDGPQISPDGSRARVDIPDGLHSLAWTVADPAVLDVVANATSDWHFDMVPNQVGATTVRFQLLFNGSPRYTSGDIPVRVTDLVPTDFNNDFSIKKNGVWTVIVNAGVVAPTHCRTANPGRLEVDAGDLTDLYFLKFIDATCGELTGSGWDVQFEFADDGIARTIHHPFHWNEKDEFHIAGVTEGQTTVTLFLMQGGNVQAVSPPIDVVVTAP